MAERSEHDLEEIAQSLDNTPDSKRETNAPTVVEKLTRRLDNLANGLFGSDTPGLELAGVGHYSQEDEGSSENSPELGTHAEQYQQMPPQRGRRKRQPAGRGNTQLLPPAPVMLYPKPAHHKRFHGLRHVWWKLLGNPAEVAKDVVMNAGDRENGLRIRKFITGEAKDVVLEDRALLRDRFLNLARSKAILSGGKYALKAVKHTTEETVGNTILRSIPFVQLASTLIHTRFIDGVKENNKLATLLTITDFLSLPLPAITTFAIPIPFIGTSVGIALSPSFYLDLWASFSANAHLRETTDNIGEYIKQVLSNTDSRLYYPRLALAQRIMEAAQARPDYFHGLHKAMNDLNPDLYIPNNPKHDELRATNANYLQNIAQREKWLRDYDGLGRWEKWKKRNKKRNMQAELTTLRYQKHKLIDLPFQEAQEIYTIWKQTREVLRSHQIHTGRR